MFSVIEQLVGRRNLITKEVSEMTKVSISCNICFSPCRKDLAFGLLGHVSIDLDLVKFVMN